jgi:gluconolactonase
MSKLFAVAVLLTCGCSPGPQLFEPDAELVDYGDIGAGEGPAWHPDKGLYYSGGGRVTLRTLEGELQNVELPGGGANGLMIDPQMRLVACQPGARRVIRIENDGSLTVLADNYEGAKFNSPNDLTIDSQGRIYFSDPRYGNRDGMEIRDEADGIVEGVYRIDAPGEVVQVIADEVDRPNGLLVSPNDEYLYVADNNNNNVGGARTLWRFNLSEDGSIDPATKKIIFDWQDGRGPDGLEMDTTGRLWVAAGRNEPVPPYETNAFDAGVYILSPDGELLDTIPIPRDETTNVAFGGEDLKTLYITAGGSLFSMRAAVPGRVSYQSQ